MKKFKISKFFKKKKNHQSKFSIPSKNSGFPNLFFLKENINQNFQFLEKIQDFQIFSKKKKIHQSNFQFLKIIQKKIHESKFSIPSKKFRISKFFKKKKKKDQKFQKKKKKKRRKFSKKALGLGALGSYFLGCLKKKSIKIFNSMKKFKIPKIF